MINHLKTVKVSLILGILLLSALPFIPQQETTVKAEKAISFHSYLEITYDISPLNQPLQIDVAVSIPVSVKFWTDIPSFFALKAIRFPFSNLFLFGAPIGPEQQIHLEINNQPTWANVYFSSPDILADIPFEGETPVNKTVNLIISPKVEAPAEPQNLDITASCETLKRLNGLSQSINIPFTPEAVPGISITTDQTSVQTPPKKITVIPMNVTNMGNVQTLVTAQINTSLEGWNAYIIPPHIILQIKEKQQMTMVVTPPDDFEGIQTIQVLFNVSSYPPIPGENGSILPVLISAYYMK